MLAAFTFQHVESSMGTDNQQDDPYTEARRRFLRLAAGGAAAAAIVGTGILTRTARAADLTPLREDDAQAKALHYTEDASSTDNAKHEKGDHCANCQFYKGKPDADRGPCQLFPGKSVNTGGWCNSYQAKS